MTNIFTDDLWSQEEQAHWLALDRICGAAGMVPGIEAIKLRQIYERYNSIVPLFTEDRETLREYKFCLPEVLDNFIAARHNFDPEKLLQEMATNGYQAYPFYHPRYPFRLRQIHNAPLVIYMRGGLEPEHVQHCAAVIGTRQPTAYGQRHAKEMAREIAATGVCVVSGMALGVDSIAHWGAIESGGKTLAVLACGVDICYPSSNKPLFKKLTEDPHCGLVSEFFPGVKPEKWHFPARNRIISGLSKAVLVIEAGETSGSLITAQLAFEQSREVYAIPGRLESMASKGTNDLIRRNVATLCVSSKQILTDMGWAPGAPVRNVPTVVELYGRERELYDMISPEPVHFDYLCEKSGIPAPELSATLTMLELAGVVTRQPGDWYSRDRAPRVSK